VGTTFTLPLPCPTWFIKGACGWWLARLVFKGSMDSTKERVPNWLSARAQRRGSRQMPIYQFSPESSMFAYIKRCLLPKKKKCLLPISLKLGAEIFLFETLTGLDKISTTGNH